MKKLFLAALFLAINISVFAQSKSVESLYNKYKNDKDFFHMDLGGNFMNFAKGLNISLDEDNMQTIAKSVERVKFFKLPTGGTAKSDFTALQKGLVKERFELMMEVSEKKSGVTMYSKGGNKIQDIIILIAGEGSDYIVLELKGDFDAKTLAKAGSSY
ncbi:DUF4252 domain-containing protein [Anditalea andensis]|uniref:DUF4252 domain-containing protein n=1 Tax=Anditalea andensis TaxID=1048983 RepID=A0A074KYU1_9BACT|nr:DUF4252 domain-containing protein [Anditalea andensis]KEO73405.1 hypothetical protein EL17_13780 [Anditalea andensis]